MFDLLIVWSYFAIGLTMVLAINKTKVFKEMKENITDIEAHLLVLILWPIVPLAFIYGVLIGCVEIAVRFVRNKTNAN